MFTASENRQIKNFFIPAVAIMIAGFLMMTLCVAQAQAADKIIDLPISNMIEKVDKNGDAYVLFVLDEAKTIGNVTYSDGTACLAFREHAEIARNYTPGAENLQAVVGVREYQGRTSYVVKKFLRD
jgi:hypothetical protein